MDRAYPFTETSSESTETDLTTTSEVVKSSQTSEVLTSSQTSLPTTEIFYDNTTIHIETSPWTTKETTVSTALTTPATSSKCKATTYDGLNFTSVSHGETSCVKCPNPDENGSVTWKCEKRNGQNPQFWPDKPFYNCTPEWLEDLKNKVNNTPPLDFMVLLQNCTEHKPLEYETSISDILGLLEQVKDNFFSMMEDPENVSDFSKGVLNVASDILKSNNTIGWKRIQEKESFRKHFGNVLQVVESLGTSILCSNHSKRHFYRSASGMSINTENIVFQVLDLKKDGNTVFMPNNKDNLTGSNQVVFPNQGSQPDSNCSSSAVGVFYKDLEVLGNIPFNDNDDKVTGPQLLNSPVIAFSLPSKENKGKNLNQPIEMFLQKNDSHNTSKHDCVFWDIHRNNWNTSGCKMSSKSNATHVVCECSHLTNFAVLMTIDQEVEKHLALQVVSIICCSCSMVGLIVTIACLSGIRSLRCRRNIITCNLSLSLLLVNFFILVGLSRTENIIVCRVMAMLLHYFLLSAFAWMVLEGYLLYQAIVVVFTKISRIPLTIFYAFGYGLPFVIVAVSSSLRFDHYSQTHYCWLSTRDGMVWSFIGPLCLLILVNSIIFIIVLKTAHSTRRKKVDKAGSAQTNWIKGSFSTMCLLGTTWILAFTYLGGKPLFTTYVFSILNGLQGFFIFIFHVVLNEKNREAVLKAVQGHYKRRSWSRDTTSTRTQNTNRTSQRSDLSAQRPETRQDFSGLPCGLESSP